MFKIKIMFLRYCCTVVFILLNYFDKLVCVFLKCALGLMLPLTPPSPRQGSECSKPSQELLCFKTKDIIFYILLLNYKF